jgi:hypothetical protein
VIWLLAIGIALLAWAGLWKRNLVLAFGVLFGVLLAWILSYFLKPFVINVKTIPVWLPPLPLATVALTLFVYGALVWIKGNEALPKKKPEEKDDSHDHH